MRGRHHYRHFLAGIPFVTAGFRHEKCQLLLLSSGGGGGHFSCDVMSNPLQNLECNISPRTVSHVNKFDEVKGSNLNRIRPYLCLVQIN